jgi:hypothetical protein
MIKHWPRLPKWPPGHLDVNKSLKEQETKRYGDIDSDYSTAMVLATEDGHLSGVVAYLVEYSENPNV